MKEIRTFLPIPALQYRDDRTDQLLEGNLLSKLIIRPSTLYTQEDR